MVCSEINVKKDLGLSEKDYKEALELCKEKGCIKTYQRKNKVFLVLLNEELPEDGIENIDGLMESVIKVVKTSKEETEEGYLFMTEKDVLQVLKISTHKLKKVMKYGLKEDFLKFAVIKKVKVVVYTQERRLSINKLV